MGIKKVDVAVIGGGPGGYTAALYCARGGLSVVVIEKMAPGGQMATTGQVDNYPGFDEGIDGFELGERMQRGAERFGAETAFCRRHRGGPAGDPKRIETTDGEIVARAVVLATGASPRELGLPEERDLRGRGIAYCATCDGMLYKGKTVVVAGGGNSAAADALHLSKLCKKVYPRPPAGCAARVACLSHAAEGQRGGIPLEQPVTEILHGERVTGVRVTDVKTGAAREVPCDGLFVAVGRVPDTALFAGQVQLDEHGYVDADETTRTNLPGVFAVGDLRSKPLRQIVTAASDGAVASHFIEEYLMQQG